MTYLWQIATIIIVRKIAIIYTLYCSTLNVPSYLHVVTILLTTQNMFVRARHQVGIMRLLFNVGKVLCEAGE